MTKDRPNDERPASEIMLYQTEDGTTRLSVRLEDETVWLTQAAMAELFQTTPQNVTIHVKSIYEDGELEAEATCKDYLQVRSEGTRQVERRLKHYNLDMVIAVGYRVYRVWQSQLAGCRPVVRRHGYVLTFVTNTKFSPRPSFLTYAADKVTHYMLLLWHLDYACAVGSNRASMPDRVIDYLRVLGTGSKRESVAAVYKPECQR